MRGEMDPRTRYVGDTLQEGAGEKIKGVDKGQFRAGDRRLYATKKGDIIEVEVLGVSGDKEGKKGLQLRHVPGEGEKQLPDFAITGEDNELAEQLQPTEDGDKVLEKKVAMFAGPGEEEAVRKQILDNENGEEIKGGRKATMEDAPMFNLGLGENDEDLRIYKDQIGVRDAKQIADVRQKIDEMGVGRSSGGNPDEFFHDWEVGQRAEARRNMGLDEGAEEEQRKKVA